MSDIIIHHIKISYDESDERVRKFVGYLKSKGAKSELEGYYKDALKQKDGKLHISDREGNEFTILCLSGHNCRLRLRGM